MHDPFRGRKNEMKERDISKPGKNIYCITYDFSLAYTGNLSTLMEKRGKERKKVR